MTDTSFTAFDSGEAFTYSETTDAAAGNTTIYTMDAGDTFNGSLSVAGDEDWVAITVDAGETIDITMTGTGGGLASGSNCNVNLVDAAGTIVQAEETFGTNYSQLGYTNTTGTPQTLYIQAQDFGGNDTGSYSIAVTNPPPPSPLDALDWGGSTVPTNNITVYFAAAGETYDGVTSLGWSTAEKNAVMDALNDLAFGVDITFTITTNPASATFKMVTESNSSVSYSAYMNPPNTTNPGVGVFNTANMDVGNIVIGSLDYMIIQHEAGHALGLAHPHDTGGGSDIMNGVSSSSDLGDFNLNQGVYTMMSYNAGYLELFPYPNNYGATVGPMALDYALLQQKYGTKTQNTGDDTYILPDSNASGTYFMAIWDSGGTDTISYSGTKNVTISLVAATLDYSATGGGVVSYADGVQGGYTIANGVVIENATGGSGNDTITGNDVGNILNGGAGNDTIYGLGGNDYLDGGAGFDSIFGGDGDDTILYDGVDSIDNLDGGDGFDTLLFEAIWVSVDLFAHGFEQSALKLIDLANEIWQQQVQYFNLDEELTEVLSQLDNGNTVHTIYDVEDNEVWSEWTRVFDFENNLIDEIFIPDAPDTAPVTNTDFATLEEINLLEIEGNLLENDSGGNLTISTVNGIPVSETGETEILSDAGTLFVQYNGDYRFVPDSSSSIFDNLDDNETYVLEFVYAATNSLGSAQDSLKINITGNTYDLIEGTGKKDKILGTDDRDKILGLGGKDKLYGGGDSDYIDGGSAKDKLFGNSGNDILIGGAGKDKLIGGEGSDLFVIDDDNQRDKIIDFEDGVDFLSLSGTGYDFDDLNITNVNKGIKISTDDGGINLLIKSSGVEIDINDFIELSDFELL